MNIAVLLKEFIFLFILLVGLLIVNAKVTIFSFSALALTLLFYLHLIKKKTLQIGEVEKYANSKSFQLINQALGSIKDTKILGIKKYLFNQYIKNLQKYEKSGFYIRVLTNIPRLLLEQVAITLILTICVYLFCKS